MADSWRPQRWRVSPTRAVPERRRFRRTHCFRGRTAPGGSDGRGGGQASRTKGGPSSTRSFHVLVGSNSSVSRRAACRENGLRDLSRWALVFVAADETRQWRRWCWFSVAAVVRLITRESRRMSEGVMPARTGRNVVSVGRMQPVMMRIVSFRLMSSFFV